MNWRQGLFRLWLLFTVVWVLGVGAVATYEVYSDPWRPIRKQVTACQTPAKRGSWCDYQPKPGSGELSDAQVFGLYEPPISITKTLILAFSIPAALLIAALAIRWVVSGFST